MSNNKALILSVLIIWSLIGGYYLLRDSEPSHEHKHANGVTAKLSAGVNVEFEMLTQNPKAGESMEVSANITSLTDSGDFDYQIFMPSEAELLSPREKGNLVLIKNEGAELIIIFKQTADYDMKVHLEIRKPGSPNASMFTFSTLDFHNNQSEVDALQDRKSKYEK